MKTGRLRAEERKIKEELYNTPANLRLKHIAFAVMAVVFILFAAMIIWFDDIPPKIHLFMRGCAGLGATIFVILAGILVYRVNSGYVKRKTSRDNRIQH